MTPHPELHTQSHGTGDILLAAAMMAIGIPLDPLSPCELIEKEGGGYGRFHLLPASMDGKHDTQAMSRAWSGLEAVPDNHCFSWLMTFIRKRPRGVSRVDDWLAWAVDHCRSLEIPTEGLPGNVNAIPDFVARFPDLRQSYIFAFVHCRDLAMRLFLEKRRVKVMVSRGRSHAIVDTRLPKPLRNELLSRTEGA